jgi:hypothetical protein
MKKKTVIYFIKLLKAIKGIQYIIIKIATIYTKEKSFEQ